MSTFVFKDDSIIGNLEAETDTFLNNCFIETNAYKTLLCFDDNDPKFFKRIIVGRTGSGKTALLKQISKNFNINPNSIIEAEKTIFEHIKNNKYISELIDSGIDLRVFFKALWIHVILTKIIEIDKNSQTVFDDMMLFFSKNNKKKTLNYFDTYKDIFFESNVLTEITTELTKKLDGETSFSKLKLNGELTDSEKRTVQSTTTNYVNQMLLRDQKEVISYFENELLSDKQKKIIIQIDDLDKSWFKNDHIHYDFINALLEAFKALLAIKSVKILISIRTDILEGVYAAGLKQEEKDQSLILVLEWSRQSIRELLDKRITHLLKNQYARKQIPLFKDIFNVHINNISADEYILDRTMLRPRDAIDFVNICFNKAQGSSVITADHILEAEESFYESRKGAIIKEWGGLYSDISHYLGAIFKIKTRTFVADDLKIKQTISDISDLFLDSNDNVGDVTPMKKLFLEDTTNEKSIELLLNVWFKVGIIGIKKSDTITIFSTFSKRKLDDSDYEKLFIIHPLFWRRD